MQFDIITGFPNFFQGPLDESIIKKAVDKGLVKINIYNLREFSEDKHKRIDDYPYGGGPGMILKPEPIFNAYDKIIENNKGKKHKVINFSPVGELLTQQLIKEYAQEEGFILLCGHYKGIDQRVIDNLVNKEVSVGNYILTGGEIPSLIFIDSIIRLLAGVLGNEDSYKTDTFYESNVDCPYYTRPPIYRNMKVPDVLLSGNHEEIEKWKKKKSKLIRKKLFENLKKIEFETENNSSVED